MHYQNLLKKNYPYFSSFIMFTKKNLIITSAIILAIIVVFILKHWLIEKQISKHNDEIKRTISEIVKNDIRNDYPSLNIPHISQDTIVVKTISNDTLITISKLYGENIVNIENEIVNYFSGFYSKQDSIFKSNSSVPFIIYPTEKDVQGNIILKTKDLENIRKHIEYLSNEVNKAVSELKDELSRDIERLNMWTSIWIGILGLLGIFIPLYAQYQSKAEFKQLKTNLETQGTTIKNTETDLRKEFRGQFDKYDVKFSNAAEKANAAKIKAEEVISKMAGIEEKTEIQETKLTNFTKSIDSLQVDITNKEKKVTQLQGKVDEYSVKLEQVEKTSISAFGNSKKALQSSKELKSVVYLSDSLGNLKQMDFYKVHLYGTKIESYLSGVFEKIKDNLNDYNEGYNSDFNDLFKGLIESMILSFRQMRGFLKKRAQLEKLDNLEVSLTKLLQMTKETKDELFKQVNNDLTNLINTLNQDE